MASGRAHLEPVQLASSEANGLVHSQDADALVSSSAIPLDSSCLGCDAILEHAEWGHYKVVLDEGKKTMVPHKKGCLTCVTAVEYGDKPKNAD